MRLIIPTLSPSWSFSVEFFLSVGPYLWQHKYMVLQHNFIPLRVDRAISQDFCITFAGINWVECGKRVK